MRKYSRLYKAPPPVSVMLFGSCHLILTLFVSSTNYFQIVRWQCCLGWLLVKEKEDEEETKKNMKEKRKKNVWPTNLWYRTVWALSKDRKRMQKEPRQKHQKKEKRFDRLASGIWPPGLLSAQVDTINYLSLTGKSSQRVIRRGNTTKAK